MYESFSSRVDSGPVATSHSPTGTRIPHLPSGNHNGARSISITCNA
jgi:hypothetical protein